MKQSVMVTLGATALLVIGASVVWINTDRPPRSLGRDDGHTAGTLPTPSADNSTTTVANLPLVTWTPMPSANHGMLHNEFRGVGAAGSSAWAVGISFNGTSDQPLIERLVGRAWQAVANRSPGTKHAELDAVAGSSPKNVWSVGRFEPTQGQERTLAEHWDGARWSVVPSANRGIFHNELDSLIVRQTNDVWAVGHSDVNSHVTDEALIEHWNGRNWSIVASAPLPGWYSQLAAIATVPHSTILWAVGSQQRGRQSTTLIERWNGHGWSVVPSPNYGEYPNTLTGVVAVSSDDAWAVGTYFYRLVPHAVIEHWNGTYWSLVRGPLEILHHYSLSGVTAVSARRIIAVGQVFSGRSDRTLVIESNGSSWTVDKSADAGVGHNQLNAITSDTLGVVLAVGSYFDGRADRTLALTSHH